MENLTTFELVQEVARKLIRKSGKYNSYQDIPVELLPFREFLIVFPTGATFVGNYEYVIAEKARNPKEFQKFKEQIELLKKQQIQIYIHLGDKAIDFEWHEDDEVIEYSYTLDNQVLFWGTAPDQETFERIFAIATRLMSGVIQCYLEPKILKKTSSDKISKLATPLRNYKSPSKKYIYRTKYVIENIEEIENENKRDYQRRTESWTVKGHIRRYKDKDGNVREVTVKPYVKGKGNAQPSNYKITQYEE